MTPGHEIALPEPAGGTNPSPPGSWGDARGSRAVRRSNPMNGIIYLIGLIVVIMAILSFLGLR
jgi:hypothetical protein